ncbi:hypothetical protein [Kitasatospora sp. NPDC097643]|uniref:hypothetical protein n=1 Tax=Kitasatospora sp. NPDC097643 TaxID=3157230 RepID=UPI00332ABD1D
MTTPQSPWIRRAAVPLTATVLLLAGAVTARYLLTHPGDCGWGKGPLKLGAGFGVLVLVVVGVLLAVLSWTLCFAERKGVVVAGRCFAALTVLAGVAAAMTAKAPYCG